MFFVFKQNKTKHNQIGEELSDQDVEDMIKEADKSGKGKIEFEGLMFCFSKTWLTSYKNKNKMLDFKRMMLAE